MLQHEPLYADSEYPMRVLMPAYLLPDHAVVSKRTGDKQYLLTRNLRIYGGDSKSEIKPPKQDMLFLVSGTNINLIASDKLLLWHAEDWELGAFLTRRREGTPQ